MKKETALRRRLARLRLFLILGSFIMLWGSAATVYYCYIHIQLKNKSSHNSQLLSGMDETIERLTVEKNKKEQLANTQNLEGAEVESVGDVPKETIVPTPGVNERPCNPSVWNNNPGSINVLVNKKHCLIPLDFAPQDLVTTHGATISSKAASDFNRMYNDAVAAGQGFIVSSSYRSYATQVNTYNYWVSVNGQAVADTVSARPGYSEHQTGFAVDLGVHGCILDCFSKTTQYSWLKSNAVNYGFIERYLSGYEEITGYQGEPWHYRYVGTSVAQDMKAKNIPTLEQYFKIEGGYYR